MMIKSIIKLAILLLAAYSCGNTKELDYVDGIPPMNNYSRSLYFYNSKGLDSKNVRINVKTGEEETVDTLSTSYYIYDSLWNLKKIIRVIKNFNNSMDSMFTFYEYNKDNKKTKTTVILPYGDILQIETRSYYKYNNLKGEKYTRIRNKSLSPYKEVSEYDTTILWFEELFEDSLVKRRDVYSLENNSKTKESSLYFNYNEDKKLTNKYTINIEGDTIGREIIEYKNGKKKKISSIYPELSSFELYDTNGCVDMYIKVQNGEIDTSFYINDKDCKVLEIRKREE